jgi:hypothetical protein
MGVCNSTKPEKTIIKPDMFSKPTIKNEYFPMGRSILISKYDIDAL